jgi:hypothetical protein
VALGAKMIRLALCVLLFSLVGNANAQKWMWDTNKREDGSIVIISSLKGFDTLDEAIKSISVKGWIGDIRVTFLTQYPELQSDINDYLLKHHPKELSEALASAGNMHNPKVIALRDAFRQSILESRFVRNINNALSNRCEKISSVSFEKFYVSNKQGNTKYEAMLWLSMQKCT